MGGRLAPVAVAALAAIIPYSRVRIPGAFPDPLNAPGTLQILALCLVFAGIAMSYDLLFGRTGLLSFGHALYVGDRGLRRDVDSQSLAPGHCGRQP